MKTYISVVGAGECGPELAEIAYRVGRLVAERGAVLVCGGLGGVMDAAAHGAKDAGGTTLGILPWDDRAGSSKFLELSVPTGLGYARNALVVRSGDGVIAVGGGYGTLSEIGLALKMGKPVVGLGTWELARDGKPATDLVAAHSPEEAVDLVFMLIASGGRTPPRRPK